jgi:hypothetical protein
MYVVTQRLGGAGSEESSAQEGFEKTVGVPPIAVGQTLHTTCATWLGTQRYSETGVAHNYSQNGFSGKGFQLSVVKPLPLKAEWGFWKCH